MKDVLEFKTAINLESVSLRHVDVSFRRTNEPKKEKKHKINLMLEYNKNFEEEGKKLVAVLTIQTPREDSHLPISVSVTYEGIFAIAGETPIEELAAFSEAAAAAILLPYVRAEITRITSLTGAPPLVIPPINVQQMFATKEPDKPQEK
ncbi:MAG: protein-export chaperone SecB [Deltaproteobacteria bacterium]|nr:protein-export chaperone SecB [Deltaproteobacteria bacterium]MDA8178539.1 protein-export chaperone SecB [Deltaproteobacteria bacterium]